MVFGFAALMLSGTASADPVRSSGPEVYEALAGNTVHGFRGATEYRSYLDASCMTLYATRTRPPQRDTWHVTDTQYCSVWEQSGESCYDLLRDGDRIAWVTPSTGQRHESTPIEGRVLSW
jgi:hypothetical protein